MNYLTFYDGTAHEFNRPGFALRNALMLANQKLDEKTLRGFRVGNFMGYVVLALLWIFVLGYFLNMMAFSGDLVLLVVMVFVVFCASVGGHSRIQIRSRALRTAITDWERAAEGYYYSPKRALLEKWIATAKLQGRELYNYDLIILRAIADGPDIERQCES